MAAAVAVKLEPAGAYLPAADTITQQTRKLEKMAAIPIQKKHPRTDGRIPLYNSRIINTYVEYLNKVYPDVGVDQILKAADMSVGEIEDPGQWFSQNQIDRFHAMAVKLTGNKRLARNAGRYTVSTKRIGAPKQYALGLMNLSSVYLMMGKLSSLLTRGATARAKKIGPDAVEIVSTPTPGTHESPHQCENRIGCLESVAKLFTKKLASIEHPDCFHKGAGFCRYIVSWERSASLKWKQLRNYFLFLSALGLLALFFFLPLKVWGIWLQSCGILVLLLWLFCDQVEKNDLRKTIETQGDAAKDLLEEINTRHNIALLVRQIGQATSMILNINDLIKTVARIIQHHLKVDRGFILLQEDKNPQTVNIASFGYTDDQLDLLERGWSQKNPHEALEIFYHPLREQKPVLINSLKNTEGKFSMGTLELFNQLETKSFLCVPLVYEKSSLGVLALDNFKSKKGFTKSDMSLLMGVASQTAMGIINAASFKKLKDSEEKYRLLADHITDVIWILDIDELRFLYVSPSIERMQRYTPDELKQLPLEKYLTSESLKLATKVIAEELALEETATVDPFRSRTLEMQAYNKEGSKFWLEVTASFLRDDNGKPIRILGVSRDISERKRAEKERKSLEAQLQQAHKLEAVGTLAGGIAHDFNNILSAVIGFTEMALFETKQDSMLYSNLQEVLKAGNRATDLVKQILAFSRQAGQEKKPIQVGIIVKEVTRLLRASLPTTIEIHQNLQSDAAVLADPTQLHQVLMNLCTNAYHAMNTKGGRLEISLANVELDDGFADSDPHVTPGSYLCLTVRDTGHGMDPGVKDRIFEPFFTTKERDQGTGLGLSVVHGIITSHGGTIAVDSAIEKGSTFKIFLPIIEKKPDARSEIKDLTPAGVERILFVDDEKPLVDMGRLMLERLGYTVTTRTSSVEALEFFRKQPNAIDLIITDMTMPNLTGEKLARELIDIRPEIPIILCTGYSQQITEEKAKKIGIKEFILKPIVMQDLAKTIRNVLDEK
ncbi:MAG: ATP-binding protein [Desulfobacterales bacterium]|jgi:PAS domain S-box-containing protein